MTRAALAFVVLLAAMASTDDSTSLTDIRVDQVGYASSAPKLAMVVNDGATGAFSVVRASDGDVGLDGHAWPAEARRRQRRSRARRRLLGSHG